MSQNQAITHGRTWDFLEPAMDPNSARTFHAVLLKPTTGNLLLYRKGQVVRQKTDGTNEWAKQGTVGYAGAPAIVKYSTLVNEFGDYILTDKAGWDASYPVLSGSVDVYHSGYFKTQDLISSGGTNEVQTETLNGGVDGGTRTLSLFGEVTAPIAWNANAATIQAALLALPSLASGDVVVSGTGPYVYTFGGNLAGADVPAIVVDDSLLTDGGAPVVDGSVFVITTPGASSITGVGRLVRGTTTAGIMELGVGGPA